MTDAQTIPARILVVEDDPRTAELIALYLRHAGHHVWTVADGGVAAARLREASWDLAILDRMLPGLDGIALCRLAAQRDAIPVIFVSALTLEEERLAGFDAGGDDYLTKPFSPRELVARVAALLRRQPPSAAELLRAGPLSLDPSDLRARLDDAAIDLTPSEFALLAALARRRGRALSRELLLDELPGPGRDALPRTIDVHIRNVRRKLDEAGAGDRVSIETVQGLGYRLTAS